MSGLFVLVLIVTLLSPLAAENPDYSSWTEPAVATEIGEVMLHWTAVGDDGYTGQAAVYDIRYRPYYMGPIDNNYHWEQATQVEGEPYPAPANYPDSMLVSGLEPGDSYYFAIKAIDDVGLSSEISNSPLKTAANILNTIDLSIIGQGQVTITPDLPEYESGQLVVLHAYPAPYWDFVAWSGDIQSNEAEIEFVIDQDYSLVAIFYTEFLPGDVNNNGMVQLSDVTYLLNYFRGTNPPPPVYLAADANGNCAVSSGDVIYLINFFSGDGPAPVRGDCGIQIISKLDPK